MHSGNHSLLRKWRCICPLLPNAIGPHPWNLRTFSVAAQFAIALYLAITVVIDEVRHNVAEGTHIHVLNGHNLDSSPLPAISKHRSSPDISDLVIGCRKDGRVGRGELEEELFIEAQSYCRVESSAGDGVSDTLVAINEGIGTHKLLMVDCLNRSGLFVTYVSDGKPAKFRLCGCVGEEDDSTHSGRRTLLEVLEGLAEDLMELPVGLLTCEGTVLDVFAATTCERAGLAA